jgi:hypothetical protein
MTTAGTSFLFNATRKWLKDNRALNWPAPETEKSMDACLSWGPHRLIETAPRAQEEKACPEA